MELHIIERQESAFHVTRLYGAGEVVVIGIDDSLDVGPVPRDPSDFCSLRREYWRQKCRGDWPAMFWDHEIRTLLRSIDTVCIWFGRHLREQARVCAAIAQLKRCGFPQERVDIVYVDGPQGLGRLGGFPTSNTQQKVKVVDSLYQMWEIGKKHLRRSLDAAEFAVLEEAWLVYTDPSPASLLRWLHQSASAAPFSLGDGFTSLLRHYPSRESGLSVWETRLLSVVPEHFETVSARSTRIVGTVGEWSAEIDCPNDPEIFRLLVSMDQTQCKNPLVETRGNRQLMRETEVALTFHGREVLEGRANYVELNGIDRWIGGVHLSSRENRVWLREGDSLVRAHIAQTPTETQ